MTMINTTGMVLAKRLRAARLLADLEQAEIAKLVGVARTTVSAWEQGRTEPSATYFVRWAQVTHQPLDWFAEAVNAETPAEAGDWVRHEGFEPPTFWSVASPGSALAFGVALLAMMRQAVQR